MSTITIELDSATEQRLQERSRREGRKTEEVAAHLLAASLEFSAPSEMTEAQLLEQINQGWKAEEWERYHALVALRKAERLTDEEYQELCALTNAREIAHANRLRFVMELARRRHMTLEDVMKQLGMGSVDVE
jgi:hypothetical protein